MKYNYNNKPNEHIMPKNYIIIYVCSLQIYTTKTVNPLIKYIHIKHENIFFT